MNLTPATLTFVAEAPEATRASRVLAQVVRGYDANRRAPRAHTKNRGEVSGGGRKPWKQKGTGRARAGSTRSPLWRKGGTVFGPRSTRNYAVTLPAKLRSRALALALNLRAESKNIFTLDSLPTDGKTKSLVPVLGDAKGKTLLVLDAPAAAVSRAGRNLAGLTVKLAAQVNAQDVLAANRIVGTQAALNLLVERTKGADQAATEAPETTNKPRAKKTKATE